MLKNPYLMQPDVAAFTRRLAEVLNGEEICYRHGKAKPAPYLTLRNALNDYRWPDRTTTIDIPGKPSIKFPPGSFAQNEKILSTLQEGMLCAYQQNQDLFGWMRATMQWGGVYRYGRGGVKGNRGWLEQNENGLVDLLNPVVAKIVADDDDFAQIANLRFNAGTTKVYSLLRPDSIIYDSRVAAALAWLILQSLNGQKVPEYLRFRCLPAQGNHIRNPRQDVFPQMNNSDHMHAKWNVRANWILSEALAISRQNNPPLSWSLREIEAALFVMGYDLQHAI